MSRKPNLYLFFSCIFISLLGCFTKEPSFPDMQRVKMPRLSSFSIVLPTNLDLDTTSIWLSPSFQNGIYTGMGFYIAFRTCRCFDSIVDMDKDIAINWFKHKHGVPKVWYANSKVITTQKGKELPIYEIYGYNDSTVYYEWRTYFGFPTCLDIEYSKKTRKDSLDFELKRIKYIANSIHL